MEGYTDGKRHGFGKYTYANGDVHEGEFGKYTFANGDVYEGEYTDGKRARQREVHVCEWSCLGGSLGGWRKGAAVSSGAP